MLVKQKFSLLCSNHQENLDISLRFKLNGRRLYPKTQ